MAALQFHPSQGGHLPWHCRRRLDRIREIPPQTLNASRGHLLHVHNV